MTSPSETEQVARPWTAYEALRLPLGVALAAPGDGEDLEAKRQQARAWLESRGIHEVRSVYDPPAS